MVWYSIVVLDDMTLLNIALYCSEAERRVSVGGVGGVGGWVVCKVIFVSNPTYIKLFWVVGCVVVLTIFSRTYFNLGNFLKFYHVGVLKASLI